ncbi:MAG: hypothetical protein AABY15_01970 [Nanoarchaeota archaeon]
MTEEALALIEKMKSKGIESVSLNIWDDFYDDDYVPEGKIQKTHAYIESGDFSEDEKELLMLCFYGYLIEKFKDELQDVKIMDYGDEIHFEHLTHKKLDAIMMELEKIELTFGGIKYNIYSES